MEKIWNSLRRRLHRGDISYVRWEFVPSSRCRDGECVVAECWLSIWHSDGRSQDQNFSHQVSRITSLMLTENFSPFFHPLLSLWFSLLFLVSLSCCKTAVKNGPWKNWVMMCWHGYLSGARCKWLAYDPADATATPSSMSSLLRKIQNGLSFCYRPSGLSWKIGRWTTAYEFGPGKSWNLLA